MAIPKLSKEEREAFLAQPHIAVAERGERRGPSAVSTPVWYGYQPGGEITVFTGSQGARRARRA